MAERIQLIVMANGEMLFRDDSSELVDGVAISHSNRQAFGGARPIPLYHVLAEGQKPHQVGSTWMVDLEDPELELARATRQYGWTKGDREVRNLISGPVDTWVKFMSATAGLSIGFWPALRTVSGEGSPLGLAFMLAWSFFVILVVARLLTEIYHRHWAVGLHTGVVLWLVIFFLGEGILYVNNSVADAVDLLKGP